MRRAAPRESAPIRDVLADPCHEQVVVDRVEVGLDVAVHYEPMPTPTREADRFERLRRASLRPESVRALLEAGFENRLDHDLHGHLRDAVADRWNPERSQLPVRFRNVPPPHRLRSIPPRPEAPLEIREELGDASP